MSQAAVIWPFNAIPALSAHFNSPTAFQNNAYCISHHVEHYFASSLHFYFYILLFFFFLSPSNVQRCFHELFHDHCTNKMSTKLPFCMHFHLLLLLLHGDRKKDVSRSRWQRHLLSCCLKPGWAERESTGVRSLEDSILFSYINSLFSFTFSSLSGFHLCVFVLSRLFLLTSLWLGPSCTIPSPVLVSS